MGAVNGRKFAWAIDKLEEEECKGEFEGLVEVEVAGFVS